MSKPEGKTRFFLYVFLWILMGANLRGCGYEADKIKREHQEINSKLDTILERLGQ